MPSRNITHAHTQRWLDFIGYRYESMSTHTLSFITFTDTEHENKWAKRDWLVYWQLPLDTLFSLCRFNAPVELVGQCSSLRLLEMDWRRPTMWASIFFGSKSRPTFGIAQRINIDSWRSFGLMAPQAELYCKHTLNWMRISTMRTSAHSHFIQVKVCCAGLAMYAKWLRRFEYNN